MLELNIATLKILILCEYQPKPPTHCDKYRYQYPPYLLRFSQHIWVYIILYTYWKAYDTVGISRMKFEYLQYQKRKNKLKKKPTSTSRSTKY